MIWTLMSKKLQLERDKEHDVSENKGFKAGLICVSVNLDFYKDNLGKAL